MSLKILCLIPARGGSKGVPRKNIMVLEGKPLIAYSIDQAKASRFINRVMVSTEDDEIANISKAYGAEVPFKRPKQYAEDLSPDLDVFIHALDWLQKEEQYHPDLIVHLRACNPVRQVKCIDEAILKLINHPEADALRSVSVARQSPFKMWWINSKGALEPVIKNFSKEEDVHSVPRQKLPKTYWQNGYVDVIRPRAIIEKGSMWGEMVIPYLVTDPFFDIDNLEDIETTRKGIRNFKLQKAPLKTPETQRYPG